MGPAHRHRRRAADRLLLASTGNSHEIRGLKHRPAGAVRTIPIPPVLVTLLRRHLHHHGTAPDGRLFPGTRGGILSESVYGRTWHHARDIVLGPDLAATALALRPYDLRHAALSLWLNAGGEPAEVAARAGNSVHGLLTVYTHCIHGHDQRLNQHITTALQAPSRAPRRRAIPGSVYQPCTPQAPPRTRHASGSHPAQTASTNAPLRT